MTDAYMEIKPDSAYYYAKELDALARKMNFKLNEAYGLDQMAYALLNLGDYPNSLHTFLSAYAIADDSKSEKNILPEKYLGPVLFLKRPVTAHLLRLDILARVIHYIGILYETAGKLDKELYYYLSAKSLKEEIENRYELTTVYSTLGRAYMAKKMPDSALFCEQKAYDLAMETGNKLYLGSILLNIGRIYSSKGNKPLAIQYYRRAHDASREQGYLRGVVACNLLLADLSKESGNIDSGLFFAKAALDVAKYQNVPSLLLRSYNSLAGIYAFIHKNDSVVKYQALVIKINNDIFNSKQQQEFQSIDFEDQQRKLKMEIAREASQNRLRIYLLLLGLFIILSVAIVLWRISVVRRRTNILLQNQKNKIQNTLTELKETQSQLIQSEKMASLGQLTAGIAHEIQNPLNFVNNFSEVNTELIGEMKQELKAGNGTEAMAIADDIEVNEQKINHHGKRADAIVRDMLQHSRAGNGQREFRNLNTVADEYLRLCYHGIKDKDSTLDVLLETNYDERVGEIKMIPQDIGRVLLNLYTNAFFAMAEKRKLKIPGYHPTLTVTTKKLTGKVELRIRDNGTGISENTVEKIFQPFFTTKPTGQGTGLGLSIAYDVITVEHGGIIRVETQEKVFTEFIVQLPG
jgi:signal transduction histidine kinase